MKDHIDRLRFDGKMFAAWGDEEVREVLRAVLVRCHELSWREEEGTEEEKREHTVLVGVYGKLYEQAKKVTEGRQEERGGVVARKAEEKDEEKEKREEPYNLPPRGWLFASEERRERLDRALGRTR